MKVIGYCWSEEPEDGDTEPRATVQQAIQLYAKRRRWPVRIQFESPDHAYDDFSQRPWGRELIGSLRAGDILLVPDPSYLFRSPNQGRVFLEIVRKKKVVAHCMDCGEDLASDRSNAMLSSVLQAMAAFEAELPAARMRIQKRQNRTDGRYLGGNPPFGYAVGEDGKLFADPKRLRLLNLMKKRRSQGVSLRMIAAEMLEKGVKISHSGVAAALKSEKPEIEDGDQ